MKKKASTSLDVTFLITGGLASHMYVNAPPPPPCPPVPGLHLEPPVPVFWPPGFGQHKLTGNVKHRGLSFALDGHDCGVCIPHVNVSPPAPINVLLALHIPFSSRKFVFTSGKTKANGSAVAASDIASLPLPMMACMDPVSAPVAFPVTNLANTLNVGVDGSDFIVGAVTIAGSVVADLICDKLGGGGGKFSLGDAIAAKFLGGKPSEVLTKMGIGIVTGVINIAVKGEGSVDVISVGSPYGQFKVTVSVSEDRKVKVGWGLEGAAPVVPVKAGVKEEAEVTRGEDGAPSRSVTVETPFGKPVDVGPTPDTPGAGARSALVGDEDVL